MGTAQTESTCSQVSVLFKKCLLSTLNKINWRDLMSSFTDCLHVLLEPLFADITTQKCIKSIQQSNTITVYTGIFSWVLKSDVTVNEL